MLFLYYSSLLYTVLLCDIKLLFFCVSEVEVRSNILEDNIEVVWCDTATVHIDFKGFINFSELNNLS